MQKVPKRVLQYAKEHFNEVKHTTLNPEGPGVVRIHLVPPKVEGDTVAPSVAILNGQDIIPVNVAWAILLSEFIDEVNLYSGKEVGPEELDNILKNVCLRMHKVFPLISKKRFISDIQTIMETFKQVAYREKVSEEISYMNIGEYAPYMRSPHRMDLLVSSMAKDGNWNCNLRCLHCYAAGQTHADEKELSTEEWKKILDKLKLIGIPQVTFTGGEPTLRKDLVELIDYAKWFVTRLNTNGIKLSRDYCDALRKASLDNLQITFYSSQRDIHNKLVGADGFDLTLEGIKNSLYLNMSVSINTPLCTLNENYVETLAFLHELGITYVTCSGLITTGNAEKKASADLQLVPKKISNILRDAVAYCAKNGMEISFTSPGWVENELCDELGITTPNCGACLSNMAITPGGNAVPCQSWLTGTTMGSFLTQDWEDIWEDPECVKRRDYAAKMRGKCPLRIGGC